MHFRWSKKNEDLVKCGEIKVANSIIKTFKTSWALFYRKRRKILCDWQDFTRQDINRTINEKIFKYFSANKRRKFVDVLDLIVDQYNNAIHSSIKMTSKEASRKENENKVWRNLYPEFDGKTITPQFSMGDSVRITKKRKHLIKDTLKDGRRRSSKFIKCHWQF